MAKSGTKRLSTRDAAEYVGYPQSILRSAVERGDLKAERPSGFERGPLYFRVDDLDAWLDAIAVEA